MMIIKTTQSSKNRFVFPLMRENKTVIVIMPGSINLEKMQDSKVQECKFKKWGIHG